MKYLSLIFILLFINVNAQKVKVKKGNVLIDGQAVAKVSAVGSEYTFTSLNNDNKVITKSHRIKINDNLEKKWITIYNSDKSKSTELDMEYFSASMNAKKLVAEFLMKKCNLITKNGVENLDTFLAKERPNLSDKYDKLVYAEVAKQNDNKKRFLEFQIYTDEEKQQITSKRELIGSYKVIDNGGIRNNIYEIYDLDNNKVAIVTTGSRETIVMLPFTNEKFFFDRTFGSDVTQAVNQLFLKDIFLGHQVKDDKIATQIAKKEMYKNKVKDKIQSLKDDSVNIYNKKGYVITKDGTKKEGYISVMFEDLYANSKKVVEYKGKAKKLIYKLQEEDRKGLKFFAKDNISFCIDEDDKCFKSLSGMLGKTFYEVLDESENSNLYLYGKPGTKIMKIVKKGDEDGYTFNTLFKKKNVKKLNEYLKCDKISDNLSEFKYNKIGDVKKLIELYNTNCK